MNKVPTALLPRFPAFSDLLTPYKSLLDFHMKFPSGLTLAGLPVEPQDQNALPIFAKESLDKLTSDILNPLYLNKKFQSLHGHASPFNMPFVKDLLPELDQMYTMEMAIALPKASMPANEGGSAMLDDMSMACDHPVSKEEAEELEKVFAEKTDEVIKKAASTFLSNHLLCLKWGSGIMQALSEQPMVKDGAARLFLFNAGCDATKDPAKKLNGYRMKSSVDEAHITSMVEVTSRLMGDADTALIISGRNQAFYKDAKKMVASLKPKVGLKELAMEPDEAALTKVMRLEANSSGTVDMRDGYLMFVKDNKLWKFRKSHERRFVPGNTAFKVMRGIPVQTLDQMEKVTFADREATFRGVVGSDKWTPGATSQASVQAEDNEEEAEEDDEEGECVAAPGLVDLSSLVVYWCMDLHPRVARCSMP